MYVCYLTLIGLAHVDRNAIKLEKNPAYSQRMGILDIKTMASPLWTGICNWLVLSRDGGARVCWQGWLPQILRLILTPTAPGIVNCLGIGSMSVNHCFHDLIHTCLGNLTLFSVLLT